MWRSFRSFQTSRTSRSWSVIAYSNQTTIQLWKSGNRWKVSQDLGQRHQIWTSRFTRNSFRLSWDNQVVYLCHDYEDDVAWWNRILWSTRIWSRLKDSSFWRIWIKWICHDLGESLRPYSWRWVAKQLAQDTESPAVLARQWALPTHLLEYWESWRKIWNNWALFVKLTHHQNDLEGHCLRCVSILRFLVNDLSDAEALSNEASLENTWVSEVRWANEIRSL